MTKVYAIVRLLLSVGHRKAGSVGERPIERAFVHMFGHAQRQSPPLAPAISTHDLRSGTGDLPLLALLAPATLVPNSQLCSVRPGSGQPGWPAAKKRGLAREREASTVRSLHRCLRPDSGLVVFVRTDGKAVRVVHGNSNALEDWRA